MLLYSKELQFRSELKFNQQVQTDRFSEFAVRVKSSVNLIFTYLLKTAETACLPRNGKR